MANLGNHASEYPRAYMVAPTLKSDRIKLFMTRTDWAFNFSKTFSMMYFLSLKEEYFWLR